MDQAIKREVEMAGPFKHYWRALSVPCPFRWDAVSRAGKNTGMPSSEWPFSMGSSRRSAGSMEQDWKCSSLSGRDRGNLVPRLLLRMAHSLSSSMQISSESLLERYHRRPRPTPSESESAVNPRVPFLLTKCLTSTCLLKPPPFI